MKFLKMEEFGGQPSRRISQYGKTLSSDEKRPGAGDRADGERLR